MYKLRTIKISVFKEDNGALYLQTDKLFFRKRLGMS